MALHVGIIPDGNRRFGALELDPGASKLEAARAGNRAGLSALAEAVGWFLADPRLRELTIYGFSEENWNRDPAEVEHIMELVDALLGVEAESVYGGVAGWIRATTQSEIDAGREPPRAELRVVERSQSRGLPEHTRALARKAEENIRACQKEAEDAGVVFSDSPTKVLNLLLSYGGGSDVELACAGSGGPAVSRMGVPRPLDLLIRSGGERRLSGFLPVQTMYAELFFLDALWPEIGTEDLNAVVDEFENRRNRRFGR